MCNFLLFCWCLFPRTNVLASGFSDPSALWSLRHRLSSIERETTEWLVVACDFTSQHWQCQSRELAIRGVVGSHIIVSLQGIIQAYKSGITLRGNTTSLGRWDFSGSFFFSVSAITTIGKSSLLAGLPHRWERNGNEDLHDQMLLQPYGASCSLSISCNR